MSLEKVPVAINLTDGVDTKTDEKLSLRPSLMQNCSHAGKGTPKKRKGLNSLSRDIEGGGTITSGKYSFGYQNQALIATDTGIYTYIDSISKWRKVQDLALSTLSSEFISNTSDKYEMAGMAKTLTEEGYVVTDSTETIPSRVFVRDSESGVIKSESIGDTNPIIISLLENIITIGWEGGVSTRLSFRNHTTGALVSYPITDTSSRFDITTDGSFIYVVYNTVSQISAYKLDKDGAVISSQTYPVGPDVLHVSSNPTAFYSDGEIHIAFVVSRGGTRWCRYFSIDTSLNVVTTQRDNFQFSDNSADVLATTVVANTGDTLTGTISLYYFYYNFNSSESGMVEFSLFNFLSTGTTPRKGIELASKSFAYGGKPYVMIKQSLPLNINWLIVDEFFNPQAMINNFDTTDGNSFATRTLNPVTSDYEIAYIDDKEFLKKSSIDFSFKEAGDFVEFGKNTFLPGSLPSRFNGESLVESQFLSRPEITFINQDGASSIPAGTYDYIAVYEYTEPNGNIIRSEPSEKVSIPNAGGNGITMNVRSLKVSHMNDSEILIRIYRKLDSDLNYLLIDEFVANNRNSDIVTTTDVTTSTDGNILLYTSGNNLPNQTMPAILSYGFSNNRLFGVRSEDTNEILFSKKYIIGEGIQFNNYQTLNVEDNQNRRTDRLVAVAGMDNKLIVFKRNTTLAIFGDGPDGTGNINGDGTANLNGGTFSEPELITTDIGCISPRSIVSTGQGLLFQSEKGIYVLARTLKAEYIGAPVEAFNNLKISGAILMEDINQVRWTTFDGNAIVFDYYYSQWSNFTNFESLGCFIHRGKMAIIKEDGKFFIEHENYGDDGKFIKQRIDTGWLKISGPQELQRVYRMLILGEYKSSHKMKVSAYYDYHSYADRVLELSPDSSGYEVLNRPSDSSIEKGGNDGTYQFNLHLKKQKCQAIKISIEDVNDGTIGESYQLTDLTFIVGRKRGAFKTRAGVDY